jgi:hypothetical protein
MRNVKLTKKQAEKILVVVGNTKDEINDLLMVFPEDKKEAAWVDKAFLASIVFEAALHCNCEADIEPQEREWERILNNGVKAKYPIALKVRDLCNKMKNEVKAIAKAA